MTNTNCRTAEEILDAITYGNPKDATFNERHWAEEQAYDHVVFTTRQQAREAYARWVVAHEEE